MPVQLSTLYADFLNGSYEMIVVQVVIGTVQRTPPRAQASARLPHREVCVQDHTIDPICKLPRRGHFFGAESPKKHSYFPVQNDLMRMAGRFSRRLRAWAKENKIPVVYSSPGERKHDIASEHHATHEVKPGLFMILV
jgi:hypothetical protein